MGKTNRQRLLRPCDLLDVCRDIANETQWTAADVGYLVKMKLVNGIKEKSKKITLVDVDSFQAFYTHIKNNR